MGEAALKLHPVNGKYNRGDGYADKIKAAISFPDMFQRYYPGNYNGQGKKATCPFHNDTDPSFVIYEQENRGHCYGCGWDGSVIDFHMKHYNCELPQALNELAEQRGLKREKLLPKERPVMYCFRHFQRKRLLVSDY